MNSSYSPSIFMHFYLVLFTFIYLHLKEKKKQKEWIGHNTPSDHDNSSNFRAWQNYQIDGSTLIMAITYLIRTCFRQKHLSSIVHISFFKKLISHLNRTCHQIYLKVTYFNFLMFTMLTFND